MDAFGIHQTVQEYYGKVLSGTKDLKTSACCTNSAPPAHIRAILSTIDDEIQDRFHGCGSHIPMAIEGQTDSR